MGKSGRIGSGLGILLIEDLMMYRKPGLIIFYLLTPILLIYIYHDAVYQMVSATNLGGTKGTDPAAEELVCGFSIFFAFLLAGPLAAYIALKRQSGKWDLLRVTPIWQPAKVLAMALSTMTVGFIQTLVVFSFGIICYSLDVEGSYLALLLLVAAYLTVPAGFGVLVASFSDDPRAQSQITTPVVALLSALGGALIAPWYLLPQLLQNIRFISPQYWAKNGYLDVISGESWYEILPNIFILVTLGSTLLFWGLVRIQRRDYL